MTVPPADSAPRSAVIDGIDEEHPEQADKGINEVAGFAERDTDHQNDEQIDRAVDAAERHTGQGQDRQGNQG